MRGLKGALYEGGIRVPFVANWPGKIKPGTTSDHISAFWDMLPTFAEITGATVPEGLDGISMLGALTGQPQKEHEFLYWEFNAMHYNGGQIAVRMGDWKAIKTRQLGNGRKGKKKKSDEPHVPGKFQLYNLKSDSTEQNNVAAQYPEIVGYIESVS